MASLDALMKKILDDSETSARQVIGEAVTKEELRQKEENNQMEKQCQRLMEEANREANNIYHQLCSEKEMQIRDENLFLKQQSVDHIFEEVKKQLEQLSEQEYLSYLSSSLKGRDLEGYFLILPDDKKVISTEEVKKALKSGGVTGTYEIVGSEILSVKNGFSLMKDSVEENHTFESEIRYLRQDMEGEVLQILYGRE